MYWKERYLVKGRCSLVDLLVWGVKSSCSLCSTSSYASMSLALSSLGSSSISSSSFLSYSNDRGMCINSMKSSFVPLDWLALSKSPKVWSSWKTTSLLLTNLFLVGFHNLNSNSSSPYPTKTCGIALSSSLDLYSLRTCTKVLHLKILK